MRMKTARLQVQLQDVEPKVIRVVDVPRDITLPELHDVLQVVVGWTDGHLHQFVAAGTAYGVPDPDDWMEQKDESQHTLKDLPQQFTYLYDFGDGWEHLVEVVGSGADQPGCVSGEGNCPPEDVGGAPGYEELLQILADPQHPEHAERCAWAQIRDFDLAHTDVLVRHTLGEVPASVRLILALVGDGVKLTPGGRLPRAFVRQVQEARPSWGYGDRPASIEEDLMPLSELHDLLRKVGLLKLSKGVLSPTKAVQDDRQIVRRLRSWWPAGGFREYLSLVSIAWLSTHGPHEVDALAEAVLPHLGHGWGIDGRSLTASDVRTSLHDLRPVFQALDLIQREKRIWSAGASATTLHPGITGLADLWSAER